MVLSWRRIIRNNGDYFRERQRVIRRCLSSIHTAVETSRRDAIRTQRIVTILVSILVPIVLLMSLVTAMVAGANYLARPSLIEQMSAVETDHQMIRNALESFYSQYGRYPSNSEGLPALLSHVPSMESEEYWTLSDPWGNPYIYRATSDGDMCTVMSLGADGRPGGGEGNKDVKFSATQKTITVDSN